MVGPRRIQASATLVHGLLVGVPVEVASQHTLCLLVIVASLGKSVIAHGLGAVLCKRACEQDFRVFVSELLVGLIVIERGGQEGALSEPRQRWMPELVHQTFGRLWSSVPMFIGFHW